MSHNHRTPEEEAANRRFWKLFWSKLSLLGKAMAILTIGYPIFLMIGFKFTDALGAPSCSGHTTEECESTGDSHSCETFCHTAEQPEGGDMDIPAKPQFYIVIGIMIIIIFLDCCVFIPVCSQAIKEHKENEEQRNQPQAAQPQQINIIQQPQMDAQQQQMYGQQPQMYGQQQF